MTAIGRQNSLAWLLLAALIAGPACSPADKPRGELMVVVSADVSAPKDINQVVVEVVTDNGNKQSFTYPILPDELGKPMPGTLALVPPNAGGQHLRVRLIAERDPGTGAPPSASVVRESVLSVPTDRIAVLPMPLRWLCDGHDVKTEDGSYQSDCGPDQTCAAGQCVDALLDTAKLLTYDPRAVFGFGGGDEQGVGGVCMNVQRCFANASSVTPDADCTLPIPSAASLGALNIAMQPASGAGECTTDQAPRCFVPLDHDPIEGWAVTNGRITLPSAVCTELASGQIQSLSLTTACPTKDGSVPLCGPWTNVIAEEPVDSAGASGAAPSGGGPAGGLGASGGEGGNVGGSSSHGGAAGTVNFGGGAESGAAGAAGVSTSLAGGVGLPGSGGSQASGGNGANAGTDGSAGTAGAGGASAGAGGASAGSGGSAAGGGGTAGAPGTIDEFPVTTANSDPQGITSGSDGNLWFTESAGNQIGRITPGGAITEFPLPTGGSAPESITLGPDGVWFTERGGDRIGRITSGGAITEFPLPSGSGPQAIALGPDGTLWFTEYHANKIGHITPTGTVTEFPRIASSGTYGITAGPDGDLWFTEAIGNNIGRITPSGTVTEFPVPTGLPAGITLGPDENLWFTESALGSDDIGRVTPDGNFAEFPVPTDGSEPWEITAGPDGNLWFTEGDDYNLGRVTPAGVITEFPVPEGYGRGITSGPDGAIWFIASNSILRFILP